MLALIFDFNEIRPELRTKKILTVIFTLNKEITLLHRDHNFAAEIFEQKLIHKL